MSTTAGNAVQLSVIVPTLNESGNIEAIVCRLSDALGELDWEVIFVDDFSFDRTADVVRRLGRTDRRVRLIERHNRRGLSSAVVEGALAATAEVVAVMDGDLQHDESVLPRLYEVVRSGNADIASASRFIGEDDARGLSSQGRKKLSRVGIRLANHAFGLDMSDPLTGFFVTRRDFVVRALPKLSELGFKILLDLITASDPPPRVIEVPFTFRERVYGESKLDQRVLYDFFLFFLEKKIRPFIPLPAQFLSFSIINSFGILVHLAAFNLITTVAAVGFAVAQLFATLIAMAFNYVVNNEVTYGEHRLSGADFYTGFVIFAAICSIGIVANVGVAVMLHEQYANLIQIVPVICGAMLSVVWNYVATRIFVWQNKFTRRVFQAAPEQPYYENNSVR